MAVRAKGTTAPNPNVGAIIVKDGKIISEKQWNEDGSVKEWLNEKWNKNTPIHLLHHGWVKSVGSWGWSSLFLSREIRIS